MFKLKCMTHIPNGFPGNPHNKGVSIHILGIQSKLVFSAGNNLVLNLISSCRASYNIVALIPLLRHILA